MPLTLPNIDTNPILQELQSRLEEGHTVTIAFGGNSMLPLIDGERDHIDLAPLQIPLHPDKHRSPFFPGDIYLFRYGRRFVIHRLLIQRGERLYFQGDNNASVETVSPAEVMARLVAIRRPDGSVVDCCSPSFRKASRKVLRRHRLRFFLHKLLGAKSRRILRPVYFTLLAFLMWAPLSGLGIPLDNFVLGIRLDHLLHASIYIPCALLLLPTKKPYSSKSLLHLFGAMGVALLTETVQYLLPYRGFDINDLIANFLGVTLGWLLIPRRRKANNAQPSEVSGWSGKN